VFKADCPQRVRAGLVSLLHTGCPRFGDPLLLAKRHSWPDRILRRTGRAPLGGIRATETFLGRFETGVPRKDRESECGSEVMTNWGEDARFARPALGGVAWNRRNDRRRAYTARDPAISRSGTCVSRLPRIHSTARGPKRKRWDVADPDLFRLLSMITRSGTTPQSVRADGIDDLESA